MRKNQETGSQFKVDQGASFTGMGFSGGQMISDVQFQANDYSFNGGQIADNSLSCNDGMNYIVDQTSEAFWQMDDKMRFTYANAACEKISGGYTNGELIGKSLLEFVAQESMDQLQHVHGGRDRDERQGIKTDVIYYEIQMKRKNGTYFWAGISASPLRDIHGTVIGYQGVLKDVSDFKKYETENKRLEGLLKKTERLTALGKMTGTVAHEVNNVMAGILGFSELLMMQNGTDGEVCGEHLKNIIGFSERIIGILQDVMTLARQDEEVRKAINLNALIPAVLRKPELTKIIGRSADAFASLDLEPSLHDIMASNSSLEKALMNLLAVSFLQAGSEGRVSVTTKTVYLGHPGGADNIREGEYVVLSVSDTGDGIADEDVSHLFEPFYIRKTLKKEATGLELTLAREVIQEHDGFIDVVSKMGNGSTFTVYLPVLCRKTPTSPYSLSQMDDQEGQPGVH